MNADDSDVTADSVVNAMLDICLSLTNGRSDDDMLDVNGFFVDLAERWDIDRQFAPIGPMTVAQFKRVLRDAKALLAAGDW